MTDYSEISPKSYEKLLKFAQSEVLIGTHPPIFGNWLTRLLCRYGKHKPAFIQDQYRKGAFNPYRFAETYCSRCGEILKNRPLVPTGCKFIKWRRYPVLK